MTESKQKSFIGSAKLISLCTLASRVLGLVRDMLTAAVFGAGPVLDAFFTAFALPNFFRRLFGEGALSSAFIPTFADELKKEDKSSARALVRQLGSALAGVLVGIVVIGEVVFLLLLKFSRPESKEAAVLKLLLILFPYLIFICLTALAAAILHSFRHFALPALSPVLLNLFWIAAVVVVGWKGGDAAEWQILLLAGVLTLAGVFQLAMQLPMLARKGMLPPPTAKFNHPGLKSVAKLMAPVMVGLAVVQLNLVVDRLIAFFLIPGPGGPSALYFGNRVMQFPLALIGIAVATAVFPSFAEVVSGGDMEGLKRLLRQAVRVTLFLAIPAAYGLMALREPIVVLLFQRRQFTALAALRTGSVVFFYGLGLWAYCLQHVLVRAFYALKDTRTPVKVACGMVAVNLALNLTLVWPLAESGLALSTALTAMVQVGLLVYLLKRRVGSLGFSRITMSLIKTISAASVMAGVCMLLTSVLSVPGGGTLARRAAAALVPTVLGAGVYVLLAWLFKMQELKYILGWGAEASE